MLFYYITDRRQFSGNAAEQRAALLVKISEATRAGVDFIQLREKDLSARELLRLAEDARDVVHRHMPSRVASGESQLGPRLLVNSRVDVAIAAGCDGVHLRSDDISAAEARVIWTNSAAGRESGRAADDFVIAASCHTAADVRRAESDGADFVVFAPVFEKGGQQGVGIDALRAACRGTAKANTPEPSPAIHIPVLALGGVTAETAQACMDAGAAGIAGIRLFQENDVAEIVARLRERAE